MSNSKEIIENFYEECWILYGFRIEDSLYSIRIWESMGDPGSVDFNWEKIFKEHRKITGFIHTHPDGDHTPSPTDDTTMSGWVRAMGKPLLCGIESEGILTMYLYWKQEGNIVYKEVNFNELYKDILHIKVDKNEFHNS